MGPYSPIILQCTVRVILQEFSLFKSDTTSDLLNPLPDMPILGSSNSTVNKDMMSKVGYGQMGDTVI